MSAFPYFFIVFEAAMNNNNMNNDFEKEITVSVRIAMKILS